MDSIYDIGGTNGKDQSREKIIIRTSIVGIAANLCLAGFKAVIGLMCNFHRHDRRDKAGGQGTG